MVAHGKDRKRGRESERSDERIKEKEEKQI